MTTDLIVTINDELVAVLEEDIRDSGDMDCTADISNRELSALLSERAELKLHSAMYVFLRDKCTADLWERLSYECSDVFDSMITKAMQERQE